MLNNIKELRTLKGMSITELSKRGGVSRSAISDIENEFKIPNQITMLKISRGFELPTSSVFNLDWHNADIEYYL